MLPSVGIAQRIFRAINRLEDRLGRKITDKELGDMVAEELNRPNAYSHAAAGEWRRKGVKDVDVLWGIARACGVNFPWLAVNEGSMISAAARAGGEEEIELKPPPRTAATQATHTEDQAKPRSKKRSGKGRRRA